MTKQGKLLVLFLPMFLSFKCETTGEYFNRKNIEAAINSNCGAYRNGEYIDATNYISVSPEDYSYLMNYYEDKESRLYKCLRFNRCK